LTESKDTNVKIVVHAENDELIWNRKDILVKDHETSRPVISENIEVLKLAEMARRTGGNLYIVHVSAGSSVEKLIKEYHEELKNQKIILESCPHYFVFNSEVYEQEDGYRYTMTPPLRAEEEKMRLNQRIDFISTIGTDHCPSEERLKKHRYTSDIFMGVGGLEYSFLTMYDLFKDKIINKYTKEPAKAYGLYPQKGNLFPGADADILVFQPSGTTKVEDESSIYNGRILKGKIDKVFLRGQPIVEDGKLYSSVGKYIRR
jgi:dihydropyrimidinase